MKRLALFITDVFGQFVVTGYAFNRLSLTIPVLTDDMVKRDRLNVSHYTRLSKGCQGNETIVANSSCIMGTKTLRHGASGKRETETMKSIIFSVSVATIVASLLFSSCSSPINSIEDPHFDRDGVCLDSLGDTFKAVNPSSLDFYVEVSGSMNGFFRANQSTAFKTDVWSIVSNFGSPGVSVLSNSGTQATKYPVISSAA